MTQSYEIMSNNWVVNEVVLSWEAPAYRYVS